MGLIGGLGRSRASFVFTAEHLRMESCGPCLPMQHWPPNASEVVEARIYRLCGAGSNVFRERGMVARFGFMIEGLSGLGRLGVFVRLGPLRKNILSFATKIKNNIYM